MEICRKEYVHFKCFYVHPSKDCIFLCDLWAPDSFQAQTYNLCNTVFVSKTENTMSYAILPCDQIDADDIAFNLRGKYTSEETLQCLGDFGIYNLLTTVTASFRSDSPKTMMNRTSLTWTSSNTARTATGSTAAIKLPNRRKSSSPVFRWPSENKAKYKQSQLCTIYSNDRL